jgi:hypothetical protein
MRVFKLFHQDDEIKTRANMNNIYMSMSLAKKVLRAYLARMNKKILNKNLQFKYENCKILEYELVLKEIH